MAKEYNITSTLPCLGITLIKLELVTKLSKSPMNVGTAKHFTIIDLKITDKGNSFIEQLNISENIPNFSKT